MKKHHLHRYFILCLIVFLHLSFTFGSVLVEVGLLKYTSLKSCDNILFFTKCDPFFKVCFETPPDNRCDWITTSNVDEKNELQDILHGTSINPNPITQSFDSWEKELTLRIQIWDANTFSQHNKIDETVWFYTGAPNISLSTVFLQGTNYKATVTVYISIHCDDYYHGPSCSVFCEPTANSYCDKNGATVCKPGVSQECSATTNVPTPPQSTIPASSLLFDMTVFNATSLRLMLWLSESTTITKSASNLISIYEHDIISDSLSGISSSQAYTHLHDTSDNKYPGIITLQQSTTKFTLFTLSSQYQSSTESVYSTHSISHTRRPHTNSDGTQTEINSPSKPRGSISLLYTANTQAIKTLSPTLNKPRPHTLANVSVPFYQTHNSINEIYKTSSLSSSVGEKNATSKPIHGNIISELVLLNDNIVYSDYRSITTSGLTAVMTLQSEPQELPGASSKVNSTRDIQLSAYAEEIEETIKTDAPTKPLSFDLVISPTATIKSMKSNPSNTELSHTSFNIHQNVKMRSSLFEPITSTDTKSKYFHPSFNEVFSTSKPLSIFFFSPSTGLSDRNTPFLHTSPSTSFTKLPPLIETTLLDTLPTALNGLKMSIVSSSSTSANTINPTSDKVSSLIIPESLHSSAKLPYHLINTANYVTPELPNVIKQIKNMNQHPDSLTNSKISQTTNHRLLSYSSPATVTASKVQESMETQSVEGTLSGKRPKTNLNDGAKVRSPSAGKIRKQDDSFVFGIGISAGALLVIGICGLALWILSKRKMRHRSWPVPVVNDELDIDGKTEYKEEIRLHRLPVIPEGEATDNSTFQSYDETELQKSSDSK